MKKIFYTLFAIALIALANNQAQAQCASGTAFNATINAPFSADGVTSNSGPMIFDNTIPANATINDIVLVVSVSKIDGSFGEGGDCNANFLTPDGSEWGEEMAMTLNTPSGPIVLFEDFNTGNGFVSDNSGASNNTLSATLTFSTTGGFTFPTGTLTTGQYDPFGDSFFASLIGDLAAGAWSLDVIDGFADDPTCVSQVSLTLCVSIPPDCAQTCADVLDNSMDCGSNNQLDNTLINDPSGDGIYSGQPAGFSIGSGDGSGIGCQTLDVPTDNGQIYTFCTQWHADYPDAFFPNSEGVAGIAFGCLATTTIAVTEANTCAAAGVVTQSFYDPIGDPLSIPPIPPGWVAGTVEGLTPGKDYVVCITYDYSQPLDATGNPCVSQPGDILNELCTNIIEFGSICDTVEAHANPYSICNGDAVSVEVHDLFNDIPVGSEGWGLMYFTATGNFPTENDPGLFPPDPSPVQELLNGNPNYLFWNIVADVPNVSEFFTSDAFDVPNTNSTCDPITHVGIVFDIDVNTFLVNPDCPIDTFTVVINPKPASPSPSASGCMLSLTPFCATNDIITITGGTAGATIVNGAVAGDVATYTPAVGDPAVDITAIVTNQYGCQTEFVFTAPGYVDAAIQINPVVMCEDAAPFDFTATPEPLAFMNLQVVIVADGFPGEMGYAVVGSDGNVYFSDVSGLLSTGTFNTGLFQVSSDPTVTYDFVWIDAFGDGLAGGTCGFPGGDGTFAVNDNLNGGVNLLPPTNDTGDGACGAGVQTANPYPFAPSLLQDVATFGGPGVTDYPTLTAPEDDGTDGLNFAQFDPAAAGPGEHTLTYDYTTAAGCVSQQATVEVDVYEKPVLGPITYSCNPDGTYNAEVDVTNVSSAAWNAILDGVEEHFVVISTSGTVLDRHVTADGTVTINNIAAGTIATIAIANGENSGTCDATINTVVPPCVACPVVAEVDGNNTICDGDLATEITDWQAAIAADAANAAAIADPLTDGTVVYSSVIVDGVMVTMPDGVVADGVNINPDKCAADIQVTHAYLLCFGADGVAGGGDDTYLHLGTHTLTVNPNTQNPTVATIGAPATSCVVKVNPFCCNDVMSISAVPVVTGGAAAANFDAATGVYVVPQGAAAGTLQVTVTNEFGCEPVNFILNTPACAASAACDPCYTTVAGITAPAATVVNSTCVAPAVVPTAGSVSAPATACPAGTTLQYSTNGVTWTAAIPAFVAGGVVYTRCNCNGNTAISSAATAVAMTADDCDPVCPPVVIPPAQCAPNSGTFPGNN